MSEFGQPAKPMPHPGTDLMPWRPREPVPVAAGDGIITTTYTYPLAETRVELGISAERAMNRISDPSMVAKLTLAALSRQLNDALLASNTETAALLQGAGELPLFSETYGANPLRRIPSLLHDAALEPAASRLAIAAAPHEALQTGLDHAKQALRLAEDLEHTSSPAPIAWFGNQNAELTQVDQGAPDLSGIMVDGEPLEPEMGDYLPVRDLAGQIQQFNAQLAGLGEHETAERAGLEAGLAFALSGLAKVVRQLRIDPSAHPKFIEDSSCDNDPRTGPTQDLRRQEGLTVVADQSTTALAGLATKMRNLAW